MFFLIHNVSAVFLFHFNLTAIVFISLMFLGKVMTTGTILTGTFMTFPQTICCPPHQNSLNCINGIQVQLIAVQEDITLIWVVLIFTLLRAHAGYMHFVSTSNRCFSSCCNNSGLEQIVLVL